MNENQAWERPVAPALPGGNARRADSRARCAAGESSDPSTREDADHDEQLDKGKA